MEIIKAQPEDFPRIRAFYHSIIDDMKGAQYHPGWQKDIYPDPDDLKNEIEEGCLYFGTVGGELAASMAVDHRFQDDAYAKADWQVDASPDEILVIHMLGVGKRHAGRGLAKEMVRFVIDMASGSGMKAVRLDVLKGNLPAEMLYLGMGFSYSNTVPMFYPDTGWMEFKLFEYEVNG